MRRLAVLALGALVPLVGCDDDATGPDRALPEGTYEIVLTGCEECSPSDTPDYLVALADGIEGTVRISGSMASEATLEFLEMRHRSSGAPDVLGWFARTAVPLTFDDELADGPGFTGSVDFGGAAALVPTIRREGGGISCAFTVFHLKHDVGPTACEIVPAS